MPCIECIKKLLEKIEAMRMKTGGVVPLNNGFNAAIDRVRVAIKTHKREDNA